MKTEVGKDEMKTQLSPYPIRILDPVGEIAPSGDVAPERVQRVLASSLNGAVIGVLTNNFRGYDIPGTVAQRIAARTKATVVSYTKPNLSHPAGAKTYGKLAERVDAVIVGLGA